MTRTEWCVGVPAVLCHCILSRVSSAWWLRLCVNMTRMDWCFDELVFLCSLLCPFTCSCVTCFEQSVLCVWYCIEKSTFNDLRGLDYMLRTVKFVCSHVSMTGNPVFFAVYFQPSGRYCIQACICCVLGCCFVKKRTLTFSIPLLCICCTQGDIMLCVN